MIAHGVHILPLPGCSHWNSGLSLASSAILSAVSFSCSTSIMLAHPTHVCRRQPCGPVRISDNRLCWTAVTADWYSRYGWSCSTNNTRSLSVPATQASGVLVGDMRAFGHHAPRAPMPFCAQRLPSARLHFSALRPLARLSLLLTSVCPSSTLPSRLYAPRIL